MAIDIDALKEYRADDTPRTAVEWWAQLTDEEQDAVLPIIYTQPARKAVAILTKHADFPCKETALKELRASLREGTVHGS